jgi:YHS domain-containing protein
MRTRLIAIMVAVLLALSVAAMAADTSKSKQKPAPPRVKKVVSAVCPVMGNKIPDVSKAPGGKSTYKGKTYYFCCPGCKTAFDKNPGKYIKKTPRK